MEPGCSRSCSEFTTKFPGMDFGKLTMNKTKLKIAMLDQLCLHSKFDASLGLQALSSRCCKEAIVQISGSPLGHGGLVPGRDDERGSATSPSGGSAGVHRERAFFGLIKRPGTLRGPEHASGPSWSRSTSTETTASLHVAIRWRGPCWKLIVCSLMGFKEAYGNPRGDSSGEQQVDPADCDRIELYEELKPWQLTVKDLLELTCSLRRDCPVHKVVLGTSKLRWSLCALLPETCLACRKHKAPRAQARKRQGKKGDRVGGGPVEWTDDNWKLSLYSHETV
ncbi:hypothetical protein Q5P01_010565 [Channa striata]|uniref:Uncharacterized protein n=1 Tax=Channa striata TaxID=64152 RepID=A0AA88N100_CHASR|nr:hypothetical protein Q5P01_010565 [Channa striata]